MEHFGNPLLGAAREAKRRTDSAIKDIARGGRRTDTVDGGGVGTASRTADGSAGHEGVQQDGGRLSRPGAHPVGPAGQRTAQQKD